MNLHIGCGYHKFPGFINIDADPAVKPDVVLDITQGLPYGDGTVDHIHTAHCLEHILYWEAVVVDMHRVLKDFGTIEIRVPYFPSGVAVFGIGHLRFFTPETFCAFIDPRLFQPSGSAKRYGGMFDMIEKVSINCMGEPKDSKFNSAPWRNAPLDAELIYKMKKTPKGYWLGKKVCDDIRTDVLGCFWCFAKLNRTGENSKTCPDCGQKYTFGEGVLNAL